MAVSLKPLYPLRQAKVRRIELGRYLKLDGGRYLIAAALMLSLMSLVSLGQTGRLATQGFYIGQLEDRREILLRERSRLEHRLSKAQSLPQIERRANEQGLRLMAPEQARYIMLVEAPRTAPAQVAGDSAPVPLPDAGRDSMTP